MSKSSSSVFIIAEIAQAHDGSLGLAHSYIDAAAKAGANAVKFQTHIASAESTPSEEWRIKFSKQDASRYDYWKRMEFSKEQWRELIIHAEEKGLDFISSPFSVEAVDLLTDVGLKFWKVASGEVNNTQLFEKIILTGQPVFLSTGMSPMDEIDKAVELLRKGTADLTVMQCTSMYPTPAEKTGLNMMEVFRNRYGLKTGLSDHSGNIYSGLAAAALGADAIEVHLTFSRDMFGPDVPASITVDEFKSLTEGVRFIKQALGNPVDKDEIAEELSDMRKLFNKSIVAKSDIAKGTILTENLIAFKKPGTGLQADNIASVLGKKASKDLKTDDLINFNDIE